MKYMTERERQVAESRRNKLNSYPPEILAQFRPVQRTDKRWAIELQPGRVLHFIEAADDKPVTVSDPDFALQSWHFKEEAEAIIGWLKRRWSLDPSVGAEINEPLTATVTISEDGES